MSDSKNSHSMEFPSPIDPQSTEACRLEFGDHGYTAMRRAVESDTTLRDAVVALELNQDDSPIERISALCALARILGFDPYKDIQELLEIEGLDPARRNTVLLFGALCMAGGMAMQRELCELADNEEDKDESGDPYTLYSILTAAVRPDANHTEGAENLRNLLERVMPADSTGVWAEIGLGCAPGRATRMSVINEWLEKGQPLLSARRDRGMAACFIEFGMALAGLIRESGEGDSDNAG